jgi:hypothetical protein
LLVLERRSRAADAVACVLLALAIASSSVGIPFAIAAAVEFAARRDLGGRLWVVAVPATLYALWSLEYGEPRAAPGAQNGLWPLLRENIPDTPAYAANAAAAAFGALTGLGLDWGRPLLVFAVIGLAVWLVNAKRLTPRAIGLISAALAYWALTGLFRAQLNLPAESRYLYFGVVLLVLLAVELFRGARVSGRAQAVLAIFVAVSALANFGTLQDGSRGLQETSAHVTAGLGALEIAGASTEPSYQPDPVRAPGVDAARYFPAVRDLGSPAATSQELRSRPEPHRQTADSVLVQALPASLETGWDKAPVGSRRPVVGAAAGGVVSKGGPGCIRFRPDGPTSALDLRVPASGLAIKPALPLEVRVRQFAGDFPANALGTVAVGTTTRLRFPYRAELVPWRARLTPSAPVTVCTLS